MIKSILMISSILFTTLLIHSEEKLNQMINQSKTKHPRLFIDENIINDLPNKIKADPIFQNLFDKIKITSDQILELEPLKYDKKGIRLLSVSRNAIKRITFLSFTYFATGDKKYAKKAEAEMLTIAEFQDWNPSHFLDVAEMTAALAIGYDWLFNELESSSKEKIKNAIIKNGLLASKPNQGWVTSKNNWNQVCNGGLTLGALAIMEDDPKLAEFIISRAIKNIPTAMKEYAPDGAYPEGPAYWEYGTVYNVLMIAALDSTFATNFGLSKKKGFLESANYISHVTTPTGNFFNYSDNRMRRTPSPSIYWMANKSNDPSLLWQEKSALKTYLMEEHKINDTIDRYLPFLIIWAKNLNDISMPKELNWYGDGTTPVAFHRSGWGSDQDLFVGLKGGSPLTSHSHMDIGNFIIEAHGKRWAEDFQPQSYNDLESKGINIWNNGAKSQRWEVLRYNNFGHNTLVVNNNHQEVSGSSKIIAHNSDETKSFSIIDMSPAYKGQLSFAKRGVLLNKNNQIIIQDEIKTLKDETKVRWAMITQAKINILSDKEVELQLDEATIKLNLECSQKIKFETFDVENSPNQWEAKNPGYKQIGFQIQVPKNTQESWRIIVNTDKQNTNTPKPTPLSKW